MTSPRLKTCHPLSVREVVSQLTEAEISGETSLVRTLLSKLCNRAIFTPKVFIFAEDSRPGYFGTRTRSSPKVGPRSPFAKDPVVVDYGYDSGEDWEDEGSCEADDVVEGSDEDGETEHPDSDSDSWLVDDDEEVVDVRTPLEERNACPLPVNFSTPQKRKLDNEDQKLGKKRKVVMPLVPFAKGPCWESIVGQCESDIFKPYKIQLFNGNYLAVTFPKTPFKFGLLPDTPLPVDPFTFVSAAVQERRSETVFAVPSLPDRLAVPKSGPPIPPSGSLNVCPPIPVVSTTVRRTAKTMFPDAHLPLLLTKINSLETGNITFLVESIYQELRGFNVKKNSIEAKIKEVGEKSKEKKVWIVKSSATVRICFYF